MIAFDSCRAKLRNRRAWLRALVVGMTLVVLGHVLAQTVRDLETYPGVDLRPKVAGARLILRGMNPYYDFRTESRPDHLRTQNDVTASPALLLFYAPLCERSWRLQRVAYFLADWVAILLCYLVLRRVFQKKAPGVAMWSAFVLLFIAGFGFRLHLERGQYYIELALLTAAASASLLGRRKSWLNVWPLALLVLLRPTYVICIAGLFLLRRMRYAAYVAGLCALVFLAMLPVTGIGDWTNYIGMIRAWDQRAQDVAYGKMPAPAPAVRSSWMEGVDYSKSLSGPSAFVDCTLLGLAGSSVSPVLAEFMHRIAPTENVFKRIQTAGLLLMFGYDLVVFYGFYRRGAAGAIPIAFVFLAPLNLELFGPEHYMYCNVLLLAPLLLILAAGLSRWKRGGWLLYGVILAVGFVIPWAAIRLNLHVQLASFLQYAGPLAILNGICIVEAWRHGDCRDAAMGEQVSTTRTVVHP